VGPVTETEKVLLQSSPKQNNLLPTLLLKNKQRREVFVRPLDPTSLEFFTIKISLDTLLVRLRKLEL